MVWAAAVYTYILIHLTPMYMRTRTFITAHHRYQSVHILPIKDCEGRTDVAEYI